jgi:hypothetical protein
MAFTSTLPGMPEPDTGFRLKCRMTWAALIKCVYEVDPLKCPTAITTGCMPQ